MILRRLALAGAAVAVTVTALFPLSAQGENAFTPSVDPVGGIALTSSPTGYSYRAFDAEAIRARIASDERWGLLVEHIAAETAEIIAMSDDELRSLIAPAPTKRALMVHRSGCPVHGGGTAVYAPFGQRVDLSIPGKVRCPVGGEVYPNAEFPDSGDGWLDTRSGSPTYGERFYFRGWFQQWFLNSIGWRLKGLAQLWFITGEDKYLHTAEVLLERFAEVYPDLDPNDLTYSGSDWGVYIKMTGSFWEGSVLLDIARSVEILHTALPNNLLTMIHERVYRSAYDAYRSRPAAANWGNNWNPPLAKFGAVLRDAEMFGFMMNDHPAAEAPVLDNQFFRDGFPYEASLSYASTYLNVASGVADALGENGRWIWNHPHMRETFGSFADLVCLDRFTHFAADMGGLVNNGWTLPVTTVEEAYRAYKTPEIARYLLQAYDVKGIGGPTTLDELFREPIDRAELETLAEAAPKQTSTVAPVRGIAILRAGEGDKRTALLMDYGYAHQAHHHADRLNINMFARGREWIPEMGYPEYMDGSAPATGGWTTNTICHATVQVNNKRQNPGVFGDLNAFVSLPGASYVDASCEDAYASEGISRYRRSLFLIPVPDGAYAVDVFRVAGGNRHDYLFHGPPVDAVFEDVSLPEPRGGTLAGNNVAFGAKSTDMRPYDLANSGQQYLFDIRETGISDTVTARWRTDADSRFTAVFVPHGEETFIAAKGYPRPSSKSLPPMPFLVRRRDGNGLESCFTTVFAAESTAAPLIVKVESLDPAPGSDPGAVAVRITHRYGQDIVLSTPSAEGRVALSDGSVRLTGLAGVVAYRPGRPPHLTLIGGTELACPETSLTLSAPTSSAKIAQVADNRIVFDRPLDVAAGDILLVDRGPVRSVYKVERTEGATVHIATSPWIGRGRADTIDSSIGTIMDSRKIFPLGDNVKTVTRNYYDGAWIVSPDGAVYSRLSSGGNGGFVLAGDNAARAGDFAPGKPFLLYDIGPGDTATVIHATDNRPDE